MSQHLSETSCGSLDKDEGAANYNWGNKYIIKRGTAAQHSMLGYLTKGT